MRGQAMALSLAGLLATLTGCNDKRPPQEGSQYPANPPPQPPNCPDLPELKNVRLKDGTVADVRIIRDGDETFYIPFSWFEWEAKQLGKSKNIAVKVKNGEYVHKSYWDSFKGFGSGYDIHQIECPGVVHEREFNYVTPFVKTQRYDGDRRIPSNFSADGEIDQVRFYKIYPERPGYKEKIENGKIDEDIESFASSHKAFIRIGKNHLASYQVFDVGNSNYGAGPKWEAFRVELLSSESWQIKRNSVRELVNWLKTPPKDRDNDRVFKLGAKDQ